MEIPFNAVGEDLDGAGFGQPGRALHQQMAIGEQGDQKSLHQAFLTDNFFADVGFELY